MDSNAPVITKARIEHPPAGTWGGRSEVIAEFTDGTTDIVVAFYNDEIQFAAEEFIGLTARQASDLFTQRDIAYLQS